MAATRGARRSQRCAATGPLISARAARWPRGAAVSRAGARRRRGARPAGQQKNRPSRSCLAAADVIDAEGSAREIFVAYATAGYRRRARPLPAEHPRSAHSRAALIRVLSGSDRLPRPGYATGVSLNDFLAKTSKPLVCQASARRHRHAAAAYFGNYRRWCCCAVRTILRSSHGGGHAERLGMEVYHSTPGSSSPRPVTSVCPNFGLMSVESKGSSSSWARYPAQSTEVGGASAQCTLNPSQRASTGHARRASSRPEDAPSGGESHAVRRRSGPPTPSRAHAKATPSHRRARAGRVQGRIEP